MNEYGKSDRPIVPVKPANNGPQISSGTPAEPVEERGLAKGNTDQQNVRRTQSRDQRANSALERVRRVAKQDKEARFTALLHHVTHERLRAAYNVRSRDPIPREGAFV